MGGKRQGMRSAPCVLVALCLLHVASSATDNPPRRHENAGAAPTTSVKKPPSELIYQQVLNKEYDIILDVRSESEFKKGHIRGALHMPGFSSATHLKGCENKKIGVYCWTGPDRATPTAQALAKVGFSSVFDLGGLQFMANMTVVTTTTISNTLPSCALKAKATQESHSSVIKVASHLVAAKVQAGAFDVIVDVRSTNEYNKGHIPGALHLPGKSAVRQIHGCETKSVAVYCWTGPDRATPVAQALKDAGFAKVYDLGGLQFMTGMKTVSGTWDEKLPTCAATLSRYSSTTICLLVVGALVLCMIVSSLFIGMVVISKRYSTRPAPQELPEFEEKPLKAAPPQPDEITKACVVVQPSGATSIGLEVSPVPVAWVQGAPPPPTKQV